VNPDSEVKKASLIHLDHIRWWLKQLLANPKWAIVGRFRRGPKISDLEIWYLPAEWDERVYSKIANRRTAFKNARRGLALRGQDLTL
jgi:hypothetical protein